MFIFLVYENIEEESDEYILIIGLLWEVDCRVGGSKVGIKS